MPLFDYTSWLSACNKTFRDDLVTQCPSILSWRALYCASDVGHSTRALVQAVLNLELVIESPSTAMSTINAWFCGPAEEAGWDIRSSWRCFYPMPRPDCLKEGTSICKDVRLHITARRNARNDTGKHINRYIRGANHWHCLEAAFSSQFNNHHIEDYRDCAWFSDWERFFV